MSEAIAAFDYRRELAKYCGEVDAAIARVIDSGRLILGAEVASFEQAFAQRFGVGHAVGVASGTDALILALRAIGIGVGDRVATVANTAVPTVSAIAAVGAVAEFVDIDPVTLQMCPLALEHHLSCSAASIQCILPVHLHGHPADMVAIEKIAAERSIPVVGDCAQAHGARIGSRDVASFGLISCYSFYPTKNLGAFGDGGMCVTNHADLADRLRSLRQYGFDADRVAQIPGVCSRLDEIQAAILNVRLKRFDDAQQQRRMIAEGYLNGLAECSFIELPCCGIAMEHAWHQFVIRSKHRDQMSGYLDGAGIGHAIHYPMPIHRMPAYENVMSDGGRQQAESLPETELAAREILSLPIYPGLREDEVCRVVQAVHDFGRELTI